MGSRRCGPCRITSPSIFPASVFALEEFTELKSLLIIGFNVHVLAQANNKWNSLFNKIVYPFIADKFPVSQQGLNRRDFKYMKISFDQINALSC